MPAGQAVVPLALADDTHQLAENGGRAREVEPQLQDSGGQQGQQESGTKNNEPMPNCISAAWIGC